MTALPVLMELQTSTADQNGLNHMDPLSESLIDDRIRIKPTLTPFTPFAPAVEFGTELLVLPAKSQ
jgi:hypothetical protein